MVRRWSSVRRHPPPAILLVMLAGVVAGCHGPSPHAAGRPHTAGGDGWTVHRDRRDGLAISTPPGRTFRAQPVPNLLQPAIPFAVGSWALPRGGSCAPTRAIRSQPSRSVLLWLFEYHANVTAREFPKRPERFHLGRLGGPFECLGVRAYAIQFRDGSRRFQVYVVVRRGGPHIRAEAGRVLSTLVVRPA